MRALKILFAIHTHNYNFTREKIVSIYSLFNVLSSTLTETLQLLHMTINKLHLLFTSLMFI